MRPITSTVKVNNTLYPNVIRSVGGLHTSPEAEKLAIEFLDDAKPEVVIGAATTLPTTRLRPTRDLLENNTRAESYAEPDRNIKNLSRRGASDAGYPSGRAQRDVRAARPQWRRQVVADAHDCHTAATRLRVHHLQRNRHPAGQDHIAPHTRLLAAGVRLLPPRLRPRYAQTPRGPEGHPRQPAPAGRGESAGQNQSVGRSKQER